MQISIRPLQGQEIKLEVQSTDTVESVKIKIQDQIGMRTDLQRLVFENQSLKNNETLSTCKIGPGSVLQLLERGAAASNIVAGGFGQGNNEKKLCFPYGVAIDDDETMIIADWGNDRIVQWKRGEDSSKVIAGGNGKGNGLNQLNCPSDVLIDKVNNSLIIADRGNNRVVRWSRNQGTTEGEVLRKDIACWGLAMDNQRQLYISDTKKNEVKRYPIDRIGEDNGTPVAGGRGRGYRDSQLNVPTYIFIDQRQMVYVSDTWNHRVMRWESTGKPTLVYQGSPRGLFVDQAGDIFVADYGKHRLVRQPKDKPEGKDTTLLAGGYGKGEAEEQLYHPWGLSCYQEASLFVADHLKHRIQRFPVGQAN